MNQKIIHLLLVVIIYSLIAQNEFNTIKGIVSDGSIPIDSARVRIQGNNNFVYSDSSGNFTIYTNKPVGKFLTISAGKQGWYNHDKSIQVGDSAKEIVLEKLPPGDNMDYPFKSPVHCSTCHQPLYDQWKTSRHSNAAKDAMVLQLYNGSDVMGNNGIQPGFKLDNPYKGGDCADCHAPTAAQWNPGDTDLNDVLLEQSVDTNGVYCDFCHKISQVDVNFNRGINGSITLKRPQADYSTDINFGSLDDVTTFWMGATYNPEFTKSALCSGCHQYKNDAGVIVDDTYNSWLKSSYATEGIQCQDCHMRPFSDSTFVSGIGVAAAIIRDPGRLYNHYFRKFGTTDSSETASMHVEHALSGDTLSVAVSVTNEKAGHNLPAGVSLRNILLVIKVNNEGEMVQQIKGDTLPAFAGNGPVEDGNYSGFPGKAFALVTYDSIKDEWPCGNWAATGIKFDTRIPPKATDKSSYKMLVHSGKGLSVEVRLLFRAVFKHWANVKGWDTREYTMADTILNIIPTGFKNIENINPAHFVLEQNYPNPFNPSTTIRYILSVKSFITLKVYDVSGKEIVKLVNSYQQPGEHRVTFNADNLSSGIYIYRIVISTGFAQSRKMIYLK